MDAGIRPDRSSHQRDWLAACRFALKTFAFAGKLRQRLAGVVAQRQTGLVVGPFAAGEELAGPAALGLDRALNGSRSGRAERHVALAAARRTQQPAAGEINLRRS